MPFISAKNLGVISMTRNVKMMEKLIKYWRVQKKSTMTAAWAQSLTEYVADLTSNDQFMEQMYDHVAGLLYTMDAAPSQAIVAFPHLANMGSMTSKLRKTYAWNEKAITMVQNRQGVQTKEVRFKVFEDFLKFENNPEVSKYFRRMIGANMEVNSTPSQSTESEPCTAIFIDEVDINEEDNECLARASELLDMEEDAERMINLGSELLDADGSVYSSRADVEDIMSMISYQTSKSSRLIGAMQDQNQIDLNLSQTNLEFEHKITLPIHKDEDGEIQIQALMDDMNVAICTHWDSQTYTKCENEALPGQYWCEEHVGLNFDRSNDFLKELKGFDQNITFNLTQSIVVENHEEFLIMDVHEYATSFEGPTDAFLHGKNQTEKLLKIAYEVYMANQSCDFDKFDHKPFRASFKEASHYSGERVKIN